MTLVRTSTTPGKSLVVSQCTLLTVSNLLWYTINRTPRLTFVALPRAYASSQYTDGQLLVLIMFLFKLNPFRVGALLSNQSSTFSFRPSSCEGVIADVHIVHSLFLFNSFCCYNFHFVVPFLFFFLLIFHFFFFTLFLFFVFFIPSLFPFLFYFVQTPGNM